MAVSSHTSAALLLGLVLGAASMDIKNGPGEIIRDIPCVKRLNQLFCGSGGNNYPDTAINTYIDDNKALLRRMYGELQEPQTVTRTTVRVVRTFGPTSRWDHTVGVPKSWDHRRSGKINFPQPQPPRTWSFAISAPLIKPQFASPPKRFRRDVLEGTLEEMLDHEQLEGGKDRWRRSSNATEESRRKRQADFPGTPEADPKKEDVCESKVEVVTPFWASNSNGKVRAVLNNKEFEQAIHQEICTLPSTLRCTRDCSCEQKYKWHRLLAYDPNNDCGGIFMDWFLYPSCCVCRCNKNPFLG